MASSTSIEVPAEHDGDHTCDAEFLLCVTVRLARPDETLARSNRVVIRENAAMERMR